MALFEVPFPDSTGIIIFMWLQQYTRINSATGLQTGKAKTCTQNSYSDSIMSELNKFKIRPWKYVVIHHSASNSGNADSIGKYHKNERGWENGLGYHFLIGNGNGSRDGQIEVGNRWDDQIDGAHAGNGEYNKHGVGICLVGNFENDYPTSSQISSLTYLINYLQKRCNIPRNQVIMHRTFRKTVCPGSHFPYNKIMARLR